MANAETRGRRSAAYVVSVVSQYNDHITECWGVGEHRPAGSRGVDPWFCMCCGRTRNDAAARPAQ